MEKLVLIDGHSILNRAFYGVPNLTNSEGLHTNAVYGFLNILFKVLDEEKADYLAVACLDEGAELRRAGLELPILILGHTPPEQAPEVVELGLTQTVFTPELAGALSRAAGAVGTRAKVHLKLDTGMSRLGFLWRAGEDNAALLSDVQALCALPACKNLSPALVEEIARAESANAHAEPVPVRDYGPAEAMTSPTKRTVRHMEIAMPTFCLGFKCEPPARGLESMRREIIGDLAAEILVGESSALYTRLYDEGLINSDFSAGYESVRDACLFSAGGDSRDPDAVLRAILDEAQRLSREGFDRALFDRLIRSSLGRRTRDLDSFESVCYRMCAYHFDGVDYFSFPEAYASVTPEDVLQFIRQVIRPERAALSIILPNESEESA